LDKSGRGNNGKLNGTVVTGVSGSGVRDSGGGFGGSSVTVPNSSSLSLAGTPYSLEAWVKPRLVPPMTYSNWRSIFYKAVYSGTWEYNLYVSGAPASKVCFSNAANGDFCANYAFKDDTWVHVAMTCDTAGVWRLYVNGTVLGSQGGHTTPLNSSTVDLVLGSASFLDLDVTQIWGRLRSQAEICADASKTWNGTACQ
jgi:hypothetical protein